MNLKKLIDKILMQEYRIPTVAEGTKLNIYQVNMSQIRRLKG